LPAGGQGNPRDFELGSGFFSDSSKECLAMNSRTAFSTAVFFAGSLGLALAVLSARPLVNDALAACSPTDKINATTADDAKMAMEKAGYTQIKILAKGCDNAWHGTAMLKGQPVFVVWNREGQVLTEGD
jgi:hypothetical protein